MHLQRPVTREKENDANLQPLPPPQSGVKCRWQDTPEMPLLRAAGGHLALVAGEAVVEVLALGGLVPLRVGLLTAAVAASARRATITHRLGAVAGR